jgi:hypothetical protein
VFREVGYLQQEKMMGLKKLMKIVLEANDSEK